MISELRPIVVVPFFAAVLAMRVPASDAQSVEPLPDAEITQLRGDLYQARTGGAYTIFLVTSDGVIIGDPINYTFARWLREQLAVRFPDRPVRYVVLSHHHFDRVDGGTVFPSARHVAHESFNAQFDEIRKTLPVVADVTDANRNGQFDPEELTGRVGAALIAAHDRNGDGSVTKDELYSYVPIAADRFRTRHTIRLGGEQVEAIHTGGWHSPDMSALFFPGQRVVFAVEPPPITMVPFSFGSAPAGQVYAWLAAIASLDFDTLLTSDGQVVPRSQLLELASYLQALREGVTTQYERGRSLAQILTTPIPEQHRGSPHYVARQMQIEALYRTLRFRTFELQAVGVANYGSRDASYCSSFTTCTGGGVVGAGTVGMSFMFSRRIGIAMEVLLSEQWWSTRTRTRYSEETALRQARGSTAVRFAPARSIVVVAGPSLTFGNARGMMIQQGQVPFGGRYQVDTRISRFGLTTGADVTVPLSARVSVAAPFRINVIMASLPADWPGRLAATAGVGLKIRLARLAR